MEFIISKDITLKKAIYPGSFDPITNGHIDIIQRASTIFDEVRIAIFKNTEKKQLLSFVERKELICDIFKDNSNIKVDIYNGLLVDYAHETKIYTVIRGLRAVSDFDYEFQLALTNRKLNENVDTVLFMTDEKFSYLSSSIVRQLIKFNADVSGLVPERVLKKVKEKYNE